MINIKTILLASVSLISSAVYAGVGSVINVTSSGTATNATIIVCANINVPTSCQTNTITGTSVVLTPANPNVYYKYMGLRAVTPGLQLFVNGAPCALNSFGFCNTPGSQASPASVAASTTGILACDGAQVSTSIGGSTWRCYTINTNVTLNCGNSATHPSCTLNNPNMPTQQQIADIFAQFGITPTLIQVDGSAIGFKLLYNLIAANQSDANGSNGTWNPGALAPEPLQQLCPCS